MENSCFKKIRCLGGSRELKIGYFRLKTAVCKKSGVQEVQRAQNRLFQIENSCFKKIRCLGGPESSKSAILDGKQLFVKNQLSRRSGELKIGYFRQKTGVWEVQRAQNRLFQMENSCFKKKSGVQEVQRAQNRLFQIENSCLYQISCLEGQRLKSGILDGKQVFILHQVFRRSIEFNIGLFLMENSCGYQIRCLGSPQSSKSVILMGNSC